MVSFRVSPEELERLNRLTDRVRETYPAYNRSDVLRELAGVEPPGVVKSVMIQMAKEETRERARVNVHGFRVIDDTD